MSARQKLSTLKPTHPSNERRTMCDAQFERNERQKGSRLPALIVVLVMMVVVLTTLLLGATILTSTVLAAASVLLLELLLVSVLLPLILGLATHVGSSERSDDAVTAEFVSECVATYTACYGAHDAALAFGTWSSLLAILLVLRIWVVWIVWCRILIVCALLWELLVLSLVVTTLRSALRSWRMPCRYAHYWLC